MSTLGNSTLPLKKSERVRENGKEFLNKNMLPGNCSTMPVLSVTFPIRFFRVTSKFFLCTCMYLCFDSFWRYLLSLIFCSLETLVFQANSSKLWQILDASKNFEHLQTLLFRMYLKMFHLLLWPLLYTSGLS